MKRVPHPSRVLCERVGILTSNQASRRSATAAHSHNGTPHPATTHYLRRPTPVPSTPAPKDYTQNCETSLHHRARQGRHEVHLLPLRPPRQHSRLRPPRRQPPHPGRHRHQPPRHQRPPRTRDVLLSRHPTAHLAHLALSHLFRIVILSEVRNPGFRVQRHNSCSDSRLGCPRSEATRRNHEQQQQ